MSPLRRASSPPQPPSPAASGPAPTSSESTTSPRWSTSPASQRHWLWSEKFAPSAMITEHSGDIDGALHELNEFLPVEECFSLRKFLLNHRAQRVKNDNL